MRKIGMTLLAALFVGPLRAQDAPRGIAVPFTVSGGVLVSERGRAADPDAQRVIPGFRAVFYPSLKIDSKWFVYSDVQVQSKPFFYYDAFYPKNEVSTRVQQLFLGYNWTGEESSIEFKAGKLPSAFGSFPLRYDDTVNPLLDQPFGYGYIVKLRPDQLPCGVSDLVHQQTYPLYMEHYCGGSTFAGEHAAAILARGQAWVTEHATALRKWVSLVVGGALVVDGLVRLLV